MKEVTIYPQSLAGEVTIPPSKSMCHRAVICAGLSEGISIIDNIGMSEDIEATCEAMRCFGVTVEKAASRLWVKGKEVLKLSSRRINCRESGSTLRFLIPIAALTGEQAVFYGEGKLVERPLTPYFDIFAGQGIEYSTNGGKLPLHVKGRLTQGEYLLEGNISSQFISGLMFALPLLEGDSRIVVTTGLESKPYIDMTMKVLQEFSVEVENDAYKAFTIKGKQKYKAVNYTVEGDFSQAAFWLAAGALGSEVACRGLDINSVQGDKAILDIIAGMGGRTASEDGAIRAFPSRLMGKTIDASQCPDLVPVLAVLGALGEGRTEIMNAGRLRLKESDRLKAISSELGKLGACIMEKPEGLVIVGKKNLQGGKVDSWNDHRIAMALAVAATKCEGPVTISNASSVRKSYPDFWEHYKALGGRIDERSMG